MILKFKSSILSLFNLNRLIEFFLTTIKKKQQQGSSDLNSGHISLSNKMKMKKILIRNIYYHEQFVFKTLVKGSNNNKNNNNNNERIRTYTTTTTILEIILK